MGTATPNHSNLRKVRLRTMASNNALLPIGQFRYRQQNYSAIIAKPTTWFVLRQPEVDTSIIDAYNPACVLANGEPVEKRRPTSSTEWERPYPNKKELTAYGKDQLVR